MGVNSETVLTVSALGSAGDGLAQDERGERWIIPSTLPGDVVRVTRGRRRSGMAIVDAFEFERRSPERAASFCAVQRCGGCVLREWSGAAAARWKHDEVVRILERAGVEASRVQPLVADGALAYRHRTRLHRTRGGTGFFAGASHQVVAFDVCKVLHPELDARVQALIRAIAKTEIVGEIECVYSPDDRRLAIEAVLDKSADEKAAQDALRALVSGRVVDGAIGVGKKHGTRRHGEPSVLLRHPAFDAAKFFLEPGVFSQANLAMNARLVALVAAAVPRGARVLELHAGAGNLTLGYAAQAATVTASEWDEQAILCLRRNVEAHGASVKILAAGDVEALRADASGANVLVLDPPRTGAKKVAEMIGSGFERIVYVSCDVATLARDAQIMAEKYRIVSATPVDMFFGTPHIECVAVFEPK